MFYVVCAWSLSLNAPLLIITQPNGLIISQLACEPRLLFAATCIAVLILQHRLASGAPQFLFKAQESRVSLSAYITDSSNTIEGY